ncbi:MAG: DegT/DnrJ/EryC1/StrS family aminotransferase [Spirochaetales bacterium]|nr:DegT/DnrJ/EryC1/StrS family aminotransferase [Spirochaetales bacterium]
MKIPVCSPVIPENAKKYVCNAIDRNWVSSRCLDEEVNYLKKLEEGFSQYIGVRFGTAVTSGTTALDLAVAALGIVPGDEVIVPDFTMIATVSAVIHNGAVPVFVDADPGTWCMDATRIEEAVTEKTRAIIPAHIYGYPCDMDAIMETAERHGIPVIEDAAEAIGTVYKGKMAGSIGRIGCFSFYANKTVTSGEGGMLVTDDEELYTKAAMLKDQGFGEPRFIHEEIGFNFRMNNLTAAYAFASFEEAGEYVKSKIRNARAYSELLAGIDGITLPPRGGDDIVNSYWMYGILIDERQFGLSKTEVRKRLKEEFGVDTRDFFYPMHKQPALLKKGFVKDGSSMPVSWRLWEKGMYLPSSTDIRPEEIKYTADALKRLKKRG